MGYCNGQYFPILYITAGATETLFSVEDPFFDPRRAGGSSTGWPPGKNIQNCNCDPLHTDGATEVISIF